MGHESPIEPWLAPDNRAACGLRTDWLRRAQVMKTAGRENQTRCLNEAASRDHGTEGHSNPAPWGGLEGKKTCGRRRSFFFLTPFIELTRSWHLTAGKSSPRATTHRKKPLNKTCAAFV